MDAIKKIGLALIVNLSFISIACADCKSVVAARQWTSERQGKWIELDPSQWEFVRGLSAMHPHTALGLPPGDRAALVELSEGGLILFIDDGQACAPMGLTK